MLNKDYHYFTTQQSLIFDDFIDQEETKELMMRDAEALTIKILKGETLQIEEI